MSAKPKTSAPAEQRDATTRAAKADAIEADAIKAHATKAHPLRAISFGDPSVSIDRRDDGTIYLRPARPLGEYPARLTDRLHHWARGEPNRVFMAERGAGSLWRQITYAQLLASARRIASGLMARGLSA